MNHPVADKEGIFNEAALKMRRIDTSWQIINQLRTNKLEWNNMYNKYNYEVIISMLSGLCFEVLDLMNHKDKIEYRFYRDKIDTLLEENPPFSKQVNTSLSGSKYESHLNSQSWYLMRSLINLLEEFTRIQLGKHGVSNPMKKDPSQAVIDM